MDGPMKVTLSLEMMPEGRNKDNGVYQTACYRLKINEAQGLIAYLDMSLNCTPTDYGKSFLMLSNFLLEKYQKKQFNCSSSPSDSNKVASPA
jgi:hypothetical protein